MSPVMSARRRPGWVKKDTTFELTGPNVSNASGIIIIIFFLSSFIATYMNKWNAKTRFHSCTHYLLLQWQLNLVLCIWPAYNVSTATSPLMPGASCQSVFATIGLMIVLDCVLNYVTTATKRTYQKRAEENERDEVGNSDVESTFTRSPSTRVIVTLSAAHTRQHDLLPTLTCRTPV